MSAPDRTAASGLSPLLAGGIVLGVLGLSAALGRRNAPGPSHPTIQRWYKRLDKLDFTPPDAVFGAVWPVLETGLAVGGYRVMREPVSPRRNLSIALWLLNTAMIGGWTQVFFRERALRGSAVASATMLATATAYAETAGKVDRVAQATAIPFVSWLGFATLLAEQIWQRNPMPRLPVR